MTNIKEINEDSNLDLLYMPSGTYKEVKNLIANINELKETDYENMDPKHRDALGAVSLSFLNNNVGGLLDELNTLEDIQKLMYEDKKLYPRYYKIANQKLQGEITGDAFLAKLNDSLGLSNNLRCVLYRSGFTVELGHIDETLVIDLITNLSERKLELGKNTNSLVFSNESVIYSKILLDFFYTHAKSCTLDVPDWREYVMLEDINLIAIYILNQIMPNGVNILRTCDNVVKGFERTEDDIKTKCDFAFTARLDPLELIKRNTKFNLTDKQKELLSRGVPRSITIKEVEEYQNSLEVNQEYILELTDNISLTLKHPRALKHITQGELWLESVEIAVDDILSDIEEDDKIKYETQINVFKTTILNKYCHFVTKITIGDAYSVKPEDIITGLKRLGSTEDTYKKIVKGFIDFIKNNTLTVIGINNYNCPKCKESQKTINDEELKEVIAINVYWSFLTICTLKLDQMDKLTESI